MGNSETEILFKNETLGYLKYILKVNIEEQPETVISDLKAELGKNDIKVI